MRFIDRLQDLRFVIGLFFTLLGVILVVTGSYFQTAETDRLNLDVFVGGVMSLFGLGMLAVSVYAVEKEEEQALNGGALPEGSV